MINDRSYRDGPRGRWVCVRLAGPGALHDGLRPVPLAGRLARPLQGVSIRHQPEFAQAVPGMKASVLVRLLRHYSCQIRIAHKAHYTLSEGCPVSCGTEKSGAFVLDR